MKVIVVHPTGNRNVRAVASSLAEAGMLSEFNTTLAVNPDSFWLNMLPKGVQTEFLRRTYALPSHLIKTRPALELSRMAFKKLGLKSLTEHEQAWASVDSIYRDLDKAVSEKLGHLKKKEKLSAVYAYEDGALETFKKAKALGIKCIYDLPIAYWETGRKLMKEEANRLPEWSATLGGGITDSEEKLQRKTEELELADVVVCPGKFVNDSLPSWANEKQKIISPFGSPEVGINGAGRKFADKGKENKKLRILFVGSMGQRKGLGDLFEAVRLLKGLPVELVVMGSLLAPMEFYKSQLPTFTYEPGRPHKEVLELMRSCDVFCLPSIVEGRALVMQEAMSQGLPVIITPNTGGEDLIIENKTGFLVPIRSPEKIAEKISWFCDNRKLIPEMGKNAQEHALKYSWSNYGNDIIKGLSSLI